MKTPQFAPDSKEAAYDINTPGGRARLFNDRIDELMRPRREGERGSTLQEASRELQLSDKPEDIQLLAAMGETPTFAQREKLKEAKFFERLDAAAELSKRGTDGGPEMKAAIAARNSREVAFNARVTELTGRGFTMNQAILQMQANPADAALLAAMGGPTA